MLLQQYHTAVILASSLTAVCARRTSSELKTQNQNATARPMHVQPPCDWYRYTPSKFSTTAVTVESHAGWTMELGQQTSTAPITRPP